MIAKSRGRAVLRLYPGVRIPDDLLVVNVIPDTGRGCPFVLLEGEYLPAWMPGWHPLEFMTIEELEADAAKRIAEALAAPDPAFAEAVGVQQAFRFPPVSPYQVTSSGSGQTSTGFLPQAMTGWTVSTSAAPTQYTIHATNTANATP